MKANVGKKIKITLQSVTLQKMLISVKLNLESLIVREDAWFFLRQPKSYFYIRLHVTEFLMNLSYSSLLIA